MRITKVNAILWLCVPVAISLLFFIMSALDIGKLLDIEPFYPGMATSILIYFYLKISSESKKLINH
jgi:hypothetical protein